MSPNTGDSIPAIEASVPVGEPPLWAILAITLQFSKYDCGHGHPMVVLVNLSASQYRDVLLQAGAFGEHQFTEVKYRVRQAGGPERSHLAGRTAVPAEEKRVVVDGRWLQAHMRPASQITLDLGMKRFVHRPSYALPAPLVS